MAGQDSISFLKRKIIGVDKLVKNKNKTETKNADLTEAVELKSKTILEKDAEIAKLKAELLATSPKKSFGLQTGLEKELEETKLLLDEKVIKLSKFKEESVSRSQKIGQLEIDLGKKNSKLAVIEKELEKKNRDIIQRALDSQELQKRLEELQAKNEALENDLNNGIKIKSLKQTYEELKWKNLAEISSLKQENAAVEKRCKDQAEVIESIQKKNKELVAILGKVTDRQKNAESVEKQLDKKEKNIASLERKLEKALKENEKLKLRLDKKGIQVSTSFDDSKEDVMERSTDSDMDVSDVDSSLTDNAVEIIPSSRSSFNFSFSKPNARFTICKPNILKQKKVKVRFKKKSSLIETLPVVFNCAPSISDSYPILSAREPSDNKPRKRKQTEEDNLKMPSSKKKLKLSKTLHEVHGPTSSPLLTSHLGSGDTCTLPDVPNTLNHSTQQSDQTDCNLMPPSTSSSYSSPKSNKQRIAHSLKPGIAPLNIQRASGKPSSDQVKVENRSNAKIQQDVSSKPFITQVLPQELSPIKSPVARKSKKQRSVSEKPSSSTKSSTSTISSTASASLTPTISTSTPATARARILASSLAPQAVEAQVKVVGGKLSQAQLEAAKRRAIPSVVHKPSVNGFRQSANENKSGTTNLANGKTTLERKKSDKKPHITDDELLYCPSRRRTNPAKVSSATACDIPHPHNGETLKSNEVATKEKSVLSTDSSDTSQASLTNSGTVTSDKECVADDDQVSIPVEQKNKVCDVTPKMDGSESSSRPSEIVGQEASGTKKLPIRREESLDEDLDISDSDDDNHEIGGPSDDYPGDEEVTDLTGSNNDRAQVDESHGETLQSGREDIVKKEKAELEYVENRENTVKKDNAEHEDVENGSDHEDRFDRLKSESQPMETAQLKKEQTVMQEEAPETQVKTGRRFLSKLEELRFNFQSRTKEELKNLQIERDKLSQERSCFAYDAYVDSIKKHFKNLMGCQNEESFGKLLNSIASNKNPQNEAIICDLIYEYLKTEHRLTPLLSEQDDNQPAITRKQQRLFVLLTTLSEMPRYQNIMERMLTLLWHNLFGRDRMFNHKLNAVENTGRMFVLCARYTDNVTLLKHFLFDLFYFKSPRNHILVGIVIALWPEIFPHRQSPLSATPLAETFGWCIFNTGPAQKSPEMKVQETKDYYVRDYDYKPNAVTADSLVTKFIKIAEERSNEKELLEEVSMCLLLLGRNKEFRWVNNNISARLLKSLASVWGSTGDQTVLRWVIITLGLLSRVYPAEGREQISSLYTSVEQMLKKGSSLQPETEQACIRALLHLGYHLQYQVAQFLKTWMPAHTLDPDTSRLLEDFVGTRGKKHAEITARVGRIEQNRARKRKGVRKRQEDL